MSTRIADYRKKAVVLRQIMSNKAVRFSRVNSTANIGTVLVSSALTFMGFAGIDKIHTYVSWIGAVEKAKVEFVFNLLVLFLFILVILHLVFRFSERQAVAERAIVSLTTLINEIDDQLDRAEDGYTIAPGVVELVRQKYDTLIQVIPSNSDREFLKAKQDYSAKEAKQGSLRLSAAEAFDVHAQRRVIEAIVRRNESIMAILGAIRRVDHSLFLGGGIVRNATWDFLHGYARPTPIDDADVVYFDRLLPAKERDEALEQRLRAQIQNVVWSVKNQARMHTINGDAEYGSLGDAVSYWPEVATAFVLRLTDDDNLEFLAPYGFSDLFRLILAPTARFKDQSVRFQKRIDAKGWLTTWPRLQVRNDGPTKRSAIP